MTEQRPRLRNNRAEMKAALHAAEHGWKKELRDSIAILPDPEQYIYTMPDELVRDLLTARRRQSVHFLPRHIGLKLRSYGLCDVRTFALTAFGFAVWKVLTEADDA